MDILLQVYNALITDIVVQTAVGLSALTGLLLVGKSLIDRKKKPIEPPKPIVEDIPPPAPEDYVVEELPPESPNPARKPDAATEARPKRTPRAKKQVDAEGAPVLHTKEETMLVGKKNKRSDTLRRNKTR